MTSRHRRPSSRRTAAMNRRRPAVTRLTKIGHYQLGRTLGVGSFGKVKHGVHDTLGHEVAVKVFPKDRIRHRKMSLKIEREIKILKLFKHPHIIRLYEVIDTPTDIFLIIEFVSGGELFDYIVERGRLEEAQARRFFQQIISGIDYCHKHMVVHRDLKPENLLLDKYNNVKIADFGLSNIMQDGTFLQSSVGSPNYAAPEVISGQLYVGPEVDIWSTGVILYALLCGKLPFDEDKISILFRKIKNADYVIPKYVSKGARDLLRRILVVDPLRRATITDIRKHPWFLRELPMYLSLRPVITKKGEIVIDRAVLREAMRRLGDMRDVESVMRDLREDRLNESTVAYYLILDRKVLEQLRESRDHLYNGPTAAVAPGSLPGSIGNGSSGMGMVSGPGGGLDVMATSPGASSIWPSLAQSLPSSSPSSTGPFSSLQEFMNYPSSLGGPGGGSSAPNPASLLSTSFQRLNEFRIDTSAPEQGDTNWDLGITTPMLPHAIMDLVYSSLKSLGFVWKIVGHFHLHCKKPRSGPDHHDEFHGVSEVAAAARVIDPEEEEEREVSEAVGVEDLRDLDSRSSSSSSSSSGSALLSPLNGVVFGCQVFRKTDGQYLLDVQRISGNVFKFIEASLVFRKDIEIRLQG